MLHGQRRQAVSVCWLLAALGALTLGELLVYPVSMALVTRIVPPARAAAGMGLWMAAVAVGQWLAGELAARWAIWPHATFFAVLAAVALAAGTSLDFSYRAQRRQSPPGEFHSRHQG